MQTAPKHVQLRLDNCLWCNKPLPSGRYDRKTHEACRVKLHRWKKKMYGATKRASIELENIEQYLNFDWMFCEAAAELKKIQDQINEIYKKHNIVRVK